MRTSTCASMRTRCALQRRTGAVAARRAPADSRTRLPITAPRAATEPSSKTTEPPSSRPPPSSSSTNLLSTTLLAGAAGAAGAGLLGSGFDPSGPSSVASALSVLALVVAVHETGHFSVARALGVRVSAFALGFGPALYSKTDEKTGVEFTIGAIPLGGYVSFPDDEVEEEEKEKEREQAAAAAGKEYKRKERPNAGEGAASSARRKISPDDPDLLKNRPLLQRAAVISAGVAFNLAAAAAVLLVQASTVGIAALEPSPGAAIPKVSAGSVAALAGVRPGDVLLAIDGKALPFGGGGGGAVDAAVARIRDSPGEELTLRLSRERGPGDGEAASSSPSSSSFSSPSPSSSSGADSSGSSSSRASRPQLSGYVDTTDIESDPRRRTLDLRVVPAPYPGDTPNTPTGREGRIGVQLATPGRVRHVAASTPGAAVSLASREYGRLAGAVLKGLGALFSDPGRAGSAVAGPVAIVAAGAEAARSDAAGLFQFAAVVNINLAVVNLLPLPALDGGYLALILLEALRGGKKLPKDVETAVMTSGLLLLMASGVALIIKDTFSLAGGGL